MKRFRIAALTFVGLLVLVSVGWLLFFDANRFRPKLEEVMAAALGRKVSFGRIRLAPLSGGITVDNLSIAADLAFGAAPVATVKAMTVGVHLRPLIFSRAIHIKTFRFEEPQFVFLRSATGPWNFVALSAWAASHASGSARVTNAAIQKITVVNGQILVEGTGRRTYDHLNLEVRQLSATSRFPFRMNAKTPGAGTVSLEGDAGPFDTSNAVKTPFRTTVGIHHLDISSIGFIDPDSGMAGVIDFSGSLESDGLVVSSRGTLSASTVRLVPRGPPARVPIQIAYESDYDTKAHRGMVKHGDVHIGRALAPLDGRLSRRSGCDDRANETCRRRDAADRG